MRLSGCRAVVTGGAKGIGKAIALKFAREGADVCIADIDKVAADALAREAKALGVKVIPFKLDVTDKVSVMQMAQTLEEAFGGLDIIVNSAGILHSAAFEDITEAEWDSIMDINLKGVFLCCQGCIGLLKNSGHGRVINIASNAGRDGGVKCGLDYATSKAGVIGFTRGLASRMAQHNITCNCIAPGTTKSDMIKAFTDEMLESLAETIPLKRLGDPEDIAELACFIASDNGAFMTGAVVDINGGLFIG